MKQLLQSLENGATEIVEVPAPGVKAGHLLVRTRASLISAGTEKMLVEFGKASYLDKARKQPEKVRQVLDKMRTDGIMATIDAVRTKLAQPIPLGYCAAGVVEAVGAGVTGFAPGDRVVTNGPHAELVLVPKNLCAKIPARDPEVPFDEAAFTPLAAVALQGIRLAAPSLGETVWVVGLGLVGLMTVQLLKASGCRVIGSDFDPKKLELARRFGATTINPAAGEDPVAAVEAFTGGRGADAVLLTASTPSSEPVRQAALASRKRGRIVLVGVTGLELDRSTFYEKELSFQVSCSYGPGRYDADYEQRGIDYPLGFVRWTEQRNFEAVLDLLAAGALDFAPLITARHPIEAAAEAYEELARGIGTVLTYPAAPPAGGTAPRSIVLAKHEAAGTVRAALVGAGNYAAAMLAPGLAKTRAERLVVAANTGARAFIVARTHGFAEAASDVDAAIHDPRVNAVFIATPPGANAALTVKALRAGRHTFVEKPLGITHAEIDAVAAVLAESPRPPLLTVGFNRRFAPHVVKLKGLLAGVSAPKAVILTVNAGFIPRTVELHDIERQGGRVINEGCHFIDLARHIVGAPITDVTARGIREPAAVHTEDKASITLSFADGSIATIHYLGNGSKAYPKERVQVFAAQRVLEIDNYTTLTGWGVPGFSKMGLWRQDKGHQALLDAFVTAVETGGPAPIPVEELLETSRATIDAALQLRA